MINRAFKLVAWFQALTRVHHTINATARMSVEVHELQEQVNGLLARVDGLVVAARRAAMEEVRYRKEELDAQERRVNESLRAAEGVASAVTVLGSDLSAELQQWVADAKREREAADPPYRDPDYREGAGFTYNPTTGKFTKPNGTIGHIEPDLLRECYANPRKPGCPSRYVIEQLYRQLPDDQVH